MKTSAEKGLALENAIEKIETAILETDPTLKEGTFKIETRKIINEAGVKHEIDIYVSINHPKGYDSVFLFESKNWKEKVGKNEIIVFQEKIKAVAAHRGFFVAKEFTNDALNQAVKDPRTVLVIATEDFDIHPFFPEIHVLTRDKHPEAELELMENKSTSKNESGQMSVDLDKDVVTLNGLDIPVREFASQLIEKAVEEKLRTEPTQTYSEGEYVLEHNQITDYNPPLICKEKTIECVGVRVRIPIRIVRPQVVSRFDIAKRGRVVTFESVAIGTGKIDFSFVAY